MSISLPHETRGLYRKKDWFHVDQGPENTGRCYQGFVNVYDQNEGDATFCCLEKSHRFHKDFFREFDEEGPWSGDFHIFKEPEMLDFYEERGCRRE